MEIGSYWNIIYIIQLICTVSPQNFSLSSSKILQYCFENYLESTVLADYNLQPYAISKITWASMKDYRLHYLVINPLSGDVFYHPRSLFIQTTWYHPCDLEMIKSFHKNERLPGIILPINDVDESKSLFRYDVPLPCLSFCRQYDALDILLPKAFWGKCGRNFGIEYEINKGEWLQKENKAWFRGTLNHGARKGRFTIVNETFNLTDIADVGFHGVWKAYKQGAATPLHWFLCSSYCG